MPKKCKLSEVVLLTKSYNLQDFKDWLHWHLNIIGFDCAHIFDNDSSVDIATVCKSYGDRVTYEAVHGFPQQYALYNRYINYQSPAWWVLPIDDDEYLYISESYNHNINDFLVAMYRNNPTWNKVCIGWRNLFPLEYTRDRINPHRVLNATGWSNVASSIWQAGNRPVKTIVKTTQKYEWSDRIGHHTHDPLIEGKPVDGYTLDGNTVRNSWQQHPTSSDVDIVLFHYQFVCDSEWEYKCKKRKSAATRKDWKNHPELYTRLYQHSIHEDTRASVLWNSQK